jgi:carnosine N-methyltransferase
VRITLRQLWRDWAAEGASEREAAYSPVIKALEREFATVHVASDQEPTDAPLDSPIDSLSGSLSSLNQDQASDGASISFGSPRVLIPGAGLSRLAFDLYTSEVEFDVEANELSYHHLMAIYWLSQEIQKGDSKYTLYPWATQFSNQIQSGRQLEGYQVPMGPASPYPLKFEIDEYGLFLFAGDSETSPTEASLMITTHDFHRYREPQFLNTFNAVATVFFLDTAPNIQAYVSIINNILCLGGVWINNGPLLWNTWENGPPARGEGDPEDNEAARSRHGFDLTGKNEEFIGKVELSWAEVLFYIEKMGFQVEEQNTSKIAGYILDKQSMMHSRYRLGYFLARKIADVPVDRC